MSWWDWAIAGSVVAIIIIDWLIVMGADPRRWKGDGNGKR